MFCRKCGEQISGAEKFCPKCGAQVVMTQQPNPGNPGGPGKAQGTGKKNVPYLAIGAIAIVLIVVIVLVKSLFFSNNYEKPIENVMKAIEKQDIDLLMSVFPDEIYEYLEEETGMDADEVIEYMEDSMESMADMYLGDIQIKYEIDDATELSKKEIKEIEEELYDIIDVKEGKAVDVEMKMYVDGEKVEDSETTMNVIKVGGKWYLDPTSL